MHFNKKKGAKLNYAKGINIVSCSNDKSHTYEDAVCLCLYNISLYIPGPSTHTKINDRFFVLFLCFKIKSTGNSRCFSYSSICSANILFRNSLLQAQKKHAKGWNTIKPWAI